MFSKGLTKAIFRWSSDRRSRRGVHVFVQATAP